MTQTADELDMTNEAAARAADEVLDEMAGDHYGYEMATAEEAVERMQARWAEHQMRGHWIRRIQEQTHEWRMDTIGDVTVLSQAGHTAVEASEVLDLAVKDDSYSEGWIDVDGRDHVPGGRGEMTKELGDVIVAHLGTISLLGLDVVDCVEAALEKNGQRDWSGWQNANHE